MDIERFSLSLTETVTAVICSTEFPRRMVSRQASLYCTRFDQGPELVPQSRRASLSLPDERKGMSLVRGGGCAALTNHSQQDQPYKLPTDIPRRRQSIDAIDQPFGSHTRERCHKAQHAHCEPHADFGFDGRQCGVFKFDLTLHLFVLLCEADGRWTKVRANILLAIGPRRSSGPNGPNGSSDGSDSHAFA